MACGAAGFRQPVRLVIRNEEGVDPDDCIDLVAVLVVRGMLKADSGNTTVVVVPGRTHAHTLNVAEFSVLEMAGDLVALDDDYPLDSSFFSFVASLDRDVFLLDLGASRERQRHNYKDQVFHGLGYY